MIYFSAGPSVSTDLLYRLHVGLGDEAIGAGICVIMSCPHPAYRNLIMYEVYLVPRFPTAILALFFSRPIRHCLRNTHFSIKLFIVLDSKYPRLGYLILSNQMGGFWVAGLVDRTFDSL